MLCCLPPDDDCAPGFRDEWNMADFASGAPPRIGFAPEAKSATMFSLNLMEGRALKARQ